MSAVPIPSNVVLGSDCYLEHADSFRAFRGRREPAITLGSRVEVYRWTDFNLEPPATLTVGDDSILVGAIFMCTERIAIGSRVIVSYNVIIADSDMHPSDPDLRRQDALGSSPSGSSVARPPLESRPVTIDDDAEIGIGSIVLKGVHIGQGARVAAGSVVHESVPAGARVAGSPARPLAPDAPAR